MKSSESMDAGISMTFQKDKQVVYMRSRFDKSNLSSPMLPILFR